MSGSDSYTVRVEIRRNGVVVGQMTWESDGFPVIMPGMRSLPTDDHAGLPPAQTDISRAMDAWISDMKRRGVTEKSIRLFTKRAAACVSFCQWNTPAELSFEGASTWLAHMRTEGKWAGTTHDQAVSALRAFSRYLTAARHVPFDPWTMLERTGETGEVGGRALTLEEVRAMVSVGCAAAVVDKRSRAPRGLFYATLALTGLRYAEACAATWGDMDLEGSPPALYSNPKWEGNKNGKRMRIVLASQIVDKLREWKRCVPSAAADPVFPVVPNRATFAKDRQAAGVPELDGRQRPLGYHSFRRSFATLLYGTGASDAVVTRLMRHAHTITHARYIDPPADLEIAAVEAIPNIFSTTNTPVIPQVEGNPRKIIRGSSKTQAREMETRYRISREVLHPDNRNTAPVPLGRTSQFESQDSGSGVSFVEDGRPGLRASAAGRGTSSDGPRDGNASHFGLQMPICAPTPADVLILMAEAIAAQSRVLEALGQMFERRSHVERGQEEQVD